MRSSISFLLGDEPRELSRIDPTMTVLQYLREVEGRIGTKDGCAEGDCGACTVVLAEPKGDRLSYRAVNACIQFVGALDGKQLLTVEDIKTRDGTLHPVQQALVDSHGSQCGYCTPGFVMSLYAHYREDRPTDRLSIDNALAGNLCRCTGYGSIVEAARSMAKKLTDFDHHRSEGEVVARLKTATKNQGVALEGESGRFFAPRSVDELAHIYLQYPDACLVAGGTDVGLWVTKQYRRLDTLIHVADVAELKTLEEADGMMRIGAAVTYEQAIDSITRHWPDFGEVIRRIGSRQIRNAGTIGGNIANASPIGDTMPMLIALNARLVLRRGPSRRDMPLEKFFLGYGKQDRQPGEFVERVEVPQAPEDRILCCYKVSKRFDQDISAVLGAFNLHIADGKIADARVCFGGMAATPRRAYATESALKGSAWTEQGIEAAQDALAKDYMPISDHRASAGYRTRIARNLLAKALFETTEPKMETRLAGAAAAAHG